MNSFIEEVTEEIYYRQFEILPLIFFKEFGVVVGVVDTYEPRNAYDIPRREEKYSNYIFKDRMENIMQVPEYFKIKILF